MREKRWHNTQEERATTTAAAVVAATATATATVTAAATAAAEGAEAAAAAPAARTAIATNLEEPVVDDEEFAVLHKGVHLGLELLHVIPVRGSDGGRSLVRSSENKCTPPQKKALSARASTWTRI